jgi:ketosteroid isomerase-like protein
MHPNEQLLTTFYSRFKEKDFKGMQDCYEDNATFSDPVFTNLNAVQAKAMWEMLIKRGKDLTIEFSNIKADDHSGSGEWTAYYTFSATGNKVVNRIRSTFRFANGKIIEHTDHFNFYKWSRQALGLNGWLLGWSPFLHHKVAETAKNGLSLFMKRQGYKESKR